MTQSLLASGDLVDCQIVFLCIGDGAQYRALKQTAEKRRLTQLFRFMPYQSEDDLRYSLSIADVHWLSHKPEFEGLLFPSKFYGIAAVGRPILRLPQTRASLQDSYQSTSAVR